METGVAVPKPLIAPKPLSVTVPTALALIGIGRTAFYKLVADKKIKTIKVGTRTLVLYSSLEAFVGAE